MDALKGIPYKTTTIHYTKTSGNHGEKAIRTFFLAFLPYPVCNAAALEM